MYPNFERHSFMFSSLIVLLSSLSILFFELYIICLPIAKFLSIMVCRTLRQSYVNCCLMTSSTSLRPFNTAIVTGVYPSLFAWSTLAPFLIRTSTTSLCPSNDAEKSGVCPSSVVAWSTLAPFSRRTSTTSLCP